MYFKFYNRLKISEVTTFLRFQRFQSSYDFRDYNYPMYSVGYNRPMYIGG
jgi:hypothetical protein